MKSFEQEQKMHDAFSGFVNLVLISILWTVFSLPLFTLGLSSATMYESINRSVRKNEGMAFRTFLSFFSSSFRKAIGPSALFSLAALVLVLGFRISLDNPDSQFWNIMSYAYRIMIFILLMLSTFIWPSFAYSREKGLRTMGLGIRLGIRHLFTSFTLALLLSLSAAAVWYMPALVIVVPGLSTLVSAMVIDRFLSKEFSDENA